VSSFTLTDCVAWVGGLAVTQYSNELSVKQSVEEKDVTVFGSGGWKSLVGGLRAVEADVKGFWESPVDEPGVTNLGTADQVISFGATATEGDPMWFFQGSNFNYDRGGGVGDVDPFGLQIRGTNKVGLVPGKVAKAKGDVSATGAIGSGLTGLSANSQVSSSQYLYAAVHVFTAGTTITLKIQSDDNSGFTTPTDRITLSAITTTGGTWVTRLAGPITDTYYRFNVSAVTGTFNLGAAIGIST
jgi:hypothetical protein